MKVIPAKSDNINDNNKVINFLLSKNVAESTSRLALDWSNCLVDKGFDVIVSYPAFSHWDFLRWNAGKVLRKTNKNLLVTVLYHGTLLKSLGLFRPHKAIKSTFKYLFNKSQWEGKKLGKVDRRIEFNNYFLYPTIKNMPNADYIIAISGCYTIPHLLYLSAEKGQIISCIPSSYDAMLKEPVDGAWHSYVLGIEKRVNVKRFAVGIGCKKSAEMFGIQVDGVVTPGTDLNLFSDGGRRGEMSPLKVTLFCNTWRPKGLDFGCAVIKRLREECTRGNLVYVGLGSMKKEYEHLFDIHLGFLDGKAFPGALRETDIFIYPSLHDGFGAPPQQAMACGCALATTVIAGTEEYGVHEENCMMAMPNDVETMTNNIKRLIRNSELRDKIRANGIKTMQRFSKEMSTNRLIRFLNQEM